MTEAKHVAQGCRLVVWLTWCRVEYAVCGLWDVAGGKKAWGELVFPPGGHEVVSGRVGFQCTCAKLGSGEGRTLSRKGYR